MEDSSDINSVFTYLEYEKIHRLSSGIPIYIDEIIEQLTFLPLSDISDIAISVNDQDEILPATVKNEITKLKEEKETLNTRTFDLLSVLSLLYNGETFDRVRRLIPTKPFQPNEVLYLLNHKLIETTQVNSFFDNAAKDNQRRSSQDK
jgi:hypothetical protein